MINTIEEADDTTISRQLIMKEIKKNPINYGLESNVIIGIKPDISFFFVVN